VVKKANKNDFKLLSLLYGDVGLGNSAQQNTDIISAEIKAKQAEE
jgi:hypothetical protein